MSLVLGDDPIAHVKVIAVDILLDDTVGLLDCLTDFLLNVRVRRVMLDQSAEVLVFIISSLAHENPVLQLLCFRLDLLSHFPTTLAVPLGTPFLERSRRECNSSRTGS